VRALGCWQRNRSTRPSALMSTTNSAA
jgi:hypothetical protein